MLIISIVAVVAYSFPPFAGFSVPWSIVVALGTTDRQGTFRLPVIRGAAYIVRARTRTGEAETRIYVNESIDGVLLSIHR